METQLGEIEHEPEHLAEISHEIFEEWFIISLTLCRYSRHPVDTKLLRLYFQRRSVDT